MKNTRGIRKGVKGVYKNGVEVVFRILDTLQIIAAGGR